MYLRPVKAPEEQRVPLPLSFLPLPWTSQKVQQRTPVNAGLGVWDSIDHFWKQMNLVSGGDIIYPTRAFNLSAGIFLKGCLVWNLSAKASFNTELRGIFFWKARHELSQMMGFQMLLNGQWWNFYHVP